MILSDFRLPPGPASHTRLFAPSTVTSVSRDGDALLSTSLTDYQTVAGAVFTHGTNSLEETLFLGDLLINCGKRESSDLVLSWLPELHADLELVT